MIEERKYAIPFAAILLCARKLIELDSDRPSPAKVAAVENGISGCIHSGVHRQEVAGEMSYRRTRKKEAPGS